MHMRISIICGKLALTTYLLQNTFDPHAWYFTILISLKDPHVYSPSETCKYTILILCDIWVDIEMSVFQSG